MGRQEGINGDIIPDLLCSLVGREIGRRVRARVFKVELESKVVVRAER
jgi:hypothetical protein